MRHFHAWRFARYCTLRGIEPEAVDAAVLARYLQDLTYRSLAIEPDRGVPRGRATVERGGGAAPRLAPAAPARGGWAGRRSRWPSMTTPPSLQEDIERWQAWLSDPDPFIDRPFRALRPVSRATRLRQVRVYLGALVESGLKPEEILDLKSVVTPRAGAHRLANPVGSCRRDGDPSTPSDGGSGAPAGSPLGQAGGAGRRELAQHRPAAPPEAFRHVEAHAAPHPGGCRESRPAAGADRPAGDHGRGRPSGRAAEQAPGLLVQTAVLIEVLLHAPIRLKNLGALRIGLQLQLTPTGSGC